PHAGRAPGGRGVLEALRQRRRGGVRDPAAERERAKEEGDQSREPSAIHCETCSNIRARTGYRKSAPVGGYLKWVCLTPRRLWSASSSSSSASGSFLPKRARCRCCAGSSSRTSFPSTVR